MLYKYDKNKLEFVKVPWIFNLLKTVTILMSLAFVMGLNFRFAAIEKPVNEFSEAEIMIIMTNYDHFTVDKLINEINRRNFRFPHIVLAQSKLETGNFTSKIFKENNNLFGMREARIRINIATSTQHQHAYYNTWRESLEDYGYYYSSYLRQLVTEEDYFNYLSQNYAEDPNYLSKLKRIIVRDSLKQKFKIK